VARDIALLERTGGRLHIAHASTAGTVDLVRRAKARGFPVTAEATPHHFTLTEAAVGEYDTNAKMSPPLRLTSDVAAVIAGLCMGSSQSAGRAIVGLFAPHQPNIELHQLVTQIQGGIALIESQQF